MSKLAIFGGKPTIDEPLKDYRTLGEEEKEAALRVLDGGSLSKFLGAWSPEFLGGPRVKEFEAACQSFFNVRNAITVNSWTSGLIAAVGAIGVSPGDEVIVPSWTMTASAAAILHWGGIPVFADIDKETFCMDPSHVKKLVTPRTVGIMTVDIFGQSSNINELMAFAESRGLKVICDTAQSPGAKVGSSFAGTLGHIGGISLNYHKHIQTGEGGVIFTNDDDLADRMRLIRNHGEAVAHDMGIARIDNIVGFNFRLGELEAAIGIEQLKKLSGLIETRRRVGEQLNQGLANLEGLELPKIASENTHVYYVYGMVLSEKCLRIGRTKIAAALRAEGIEGLSPGYQNLHMLPTFQNKTALGSKGFPWTLFKKSSIDYSHGSLPVSEKLHETSFLGINTCKFEYTEDEVELVIEAFRKVWNNLDELHNLE